MNWEVVAILAIFGAGMAFVAGAEYFLGRRRAKRERQ